ncbi:type II secretion system protein GspD [Deinococcus sp.]|uniref:type II secretion system protein GspD n=1 Tax=Deinococcus sp. TaxID=47478 RepID=UPI0025C6F85D|nr:secretin N-terminal domain-containing protein [Deinococcus sp.]
MLSQLDQPKAELDAQIVQKVFPLVNASAEELKATLEGTLSRDIAQQTASNLAANATLLDPVTGQPYAGKSVADSPMNQANTASAAGTSTAAGTPATTTGAAATAPGAAVLATPAANIIADRRTNTLIVRGTQAQVAQIAELIPQLDKIVPQINVQVRIQEITESALKSLGIDWNAKIGGFSVSLGGSNGLSATFDPTRTLVGFNVFPTLNALENQSVSKKVYDGSITMQSGQRSLGNASATQNASSSAAATVKSGGRLDINIPSAAANVPAIQKVVDYGVILDFFDPQVAPDGTITLRVHGQVNDLVTNIPDNGIGVPNILKFTNSEAQSIITFKSGQTVLLSGLMGSNATNQNNGVPYLSTIPVVGGLFGSQSKRSSATQLLVVVTGTVVQ